MLGLDFGDFIILVFTLIMMLASFGLFVLWYQADKQVERLRSRIVELEGKSTKPASAPEQGRTMPYDTTADRL